MRKNENINASKLPVLKHSILVSLILYNLTVFKMITAIKYAKQPIPRMATVLATLTSHGQNPTMTPIQLYVNLTTTPETTTPVTTTPSVPEFILGKGLLAAALALIVFRKRQRCRP